MKNKLGMALLLGIIAMGLQFPQAEAGNMDTYRNLLVNKTYTIQYDNITPLERVTNKDKVSLYGYSGMAVDKNDYLTNRQISGVLVRNGRDRYESVGNDVYNMCRLTMGGKNFNFYKYKKGSSWSFIGGKNNVVMPIEENVIAEMTSGESYGDPDMSKVMNAILPENLQPADATRFEYVTSGWLDNGLNYEDYQSVSSDNGMEAIRYYFNGYTLCKIAYASIYKDANGKNVGRKFIIKVNSFSPTPDLSLLNFPNALKSGDKGNNKGEDDDE